ncbi:MAG: hypothetical protein OCD76_19280 [Reichenbachiella sp.]
MPKDPDEIKKPNGLSLITVGIVVGIALNINAFLEAPNVNSQISALGSISIDCSNSASLAMNFRIWVIGINIIISIITILTIYAESLKSRVFIISLFSFHLISAIVIYLLVPHSCSEAFTGYGIDEIQYNLIWLIIIFAYFKFSRSAEQYYTLLRAT